MKAPLWLRADPVFRGLLMVLREPQSRVYIGEKPPQLLHIERNPTKYIRRVSFDRKSSAPVSEQWFEGYDSGIQTGGVTWASSVVLPPPPHPTIIVQTITIKIISTVLFSLLISYLPLND